MSIRACLLLSVSILAISVSLLLFDELSKAINKKNLIESSSRNVESMDLLIKSASNWAMERGLSKSGLESENVNNTNLISRITKHRDIADKAYEEALSQIKNYDFYHKDELMAKLEGTHRGIKNLRSSVDRDLAKAKDQRDPQLLKSLIPLATKNIMASQDVRYQLAIITSKADAVLGKMSDIKHFTWLLSEFAGRERAIVAGIISSGNKITKKQLIMLSEYRGRIEGAAETVEKLSEEIGGELLESVENAKQLYFGEFSAVRELFYGNESEEHQINADKWISESTLAINSVLNIVKQTTAESKNYMEELLSSANSTITFMIIASIICLLLVAFAFFVVIKRVVTPINNMVSAMNILSSGNTDVEIPYSGATDEIGKIAASVSVFKDNAIEKNKLEAEQKLLEEKAEREKHESMAKLANSFEERVQGIITTVANAATELTQTAESMSEVIDKSDRTAKNATSSATITEDNVRSVAAAAEEMSASVAEISSQIQRSSTLVDNSVKMVEDADSYASALTASSSKVSEVLQLISDIAEQINLLALNATIESARAGEAGKGFAVVASEVKNLASKTADSVEEIEKVIGEMGNASDDIVRVLSDIKGAVASISDSSGSIASAVEEQTATTSEISRNMNSASKGTEEISASLQEVSNSAGEASASSVQVLSSAQDLSSQSEVLDQQVKEFLSDIRAA